MLLEGTDVKSLLLMLVWLITCMERKYADTVGNRIEHTAAAYVSEDIWWPLIDVADSCEETHQELDDPS